MYGRPGRLLGADALEGILYDEESDPLEDAA
jgi:hypothetical protein